MRSRPRGQQGVPFGPTRIGDSIEGPPRDTCAGSSPLVLPKRLTRERCRLLCMRGIACASQLGFQSKHLCGAQPRFPSPRTCFHASSNSSSILSPSLMKPLLSSPLLSSPTLSLALMNTHHSSRDTLISDIFLIHK